MILFLKFFPITILLFCISENAHTSERPHQSLERAFKGETPLFAVSVVRVTPDNDEDYVPLTTEDSLLVFSVLEMLLGYHNQGEFDRKLEETVRASIERFSNLTRRKYNIEQETNTNITQIIQGVVSREIRTEDLATSSIDLTPHMIHLLNTKGQEKDKIVEEISKLFIQGTKNPKQKVTALLAKIKDKITQQIRVSFFASDYDFLEKITEKIRDFKAKNNHLAQAMDDQVLEQMMKEKTQQLQQQYAHLSRNLSKIQSLPWYDRFKNNWCIIALNEMFFSKKVPMSQSAVEDIEAMAKSFSQRNKKTILQVNFLQEWWEDQRKDYAQSFIRTSRENYQHTYHHQRTYNLAKPAIFEPDSGSQLKDDLYLSSSDLHAVHGQFKFLENTSWSYWNGEKVSFYRKATYKKEADELLQDGAFYLFGMGVDMPFGVLDEYGRVDQVLCNYLSTEICYDFDVGIRKYFNNYPKNQRIHVVASNTLPNLNPSHLPAQSPFILHADPTKHMNNLLVNTNRIMILNTSAEPITEELQGVIKEASSNIFREASPLHSIYWVKDAKNIFIINIWNLTKNEG